ncbi:ABC transporter substrate-binding protein [Winogradskyella sp.]|uniref:ABC transporter substrate-binding protein n=1 Tax=Winogradskyella sp. TaxID=1883156 RepID=UPI003519693C
MKKAFYILLPILILLYGCKNEKGLKRDLPESVAKTIDLKYAKGFTVDYNSNFKVLTINNPWPESEKTYKYLIASKEQLSKMTFPKDAYDGVFSDSITKLVVTSTTHIPALELLGVEHTLVGFPGTDYISSEKTRQRIDEGNIRELGKNEGINTEVLLEVDPNVVIGFGVDGVNKTFETIKKAGVPVIYNGDWVESSALARAEWIKFFGVLFNKEQKADSIFNTIENSYLEAKEIAQNAKDKPTVLSGVMNGNVWELPNGTSFEAQFLKDANLKYLWSDTTGNGSLKLSFEAVFEKAKDADLWLSPSYYSSLEQLEKANKLYTSFEAFKTKNIYSFTNTKGATGGVLYYELGTTRPDLILRDLIKIGHPELLEGYTPYFFKRLD